MSIIKHCLYSDSRQCTQHISRTSCRRAAATICLRPCKLTVSSYLFARWHLFRHVGYLRHQQQVDLWPSDLESGVRVTCDGGYLCAKFSLPRPLCSRVRPDVRDRQTDVRRQTKASLSASALWRRRHNKAIWQCKSSLACKNDQNSIQNEKSTHRDANTARALAVVRFGHRPPARPPVANTPTDRTDNNTLRR